MEPLAVMPICASEGSIFPVNSYVVYGETEAVIVDAQFEQSNAKRVVQAAKDTGKKVKAVFITHSDPDYYFGLAEIVDAFPGIQVYSTQATAQLIEATKGVKSEIWNPQLGDEAPKRIIVPEATDTPLTVDGVELSIRGQLFDEEHTHLWIESQGMAIGGIHLDQGRHLWLADSSEFFLRAQWRSDLEEILALKPKKFYPGHSVKQVPAEGLCDHFVYQTLDYLHTVEHELVTVKSTEEIANTLIERYPDLASKEIVGMGIGVIRGEMDWETAHVFTGNGKRWIADFGDFAFRLDFTQPGIVTYLGIKGEAMMGATDTIPYEYRLIGIDTFAVSWVETAGSKVVHIEDFASGIVHTNIAAPDGSFTRLSGTLTPDN